MPMSRQLTKHADKAYREIIHLQVGQCGNQVGSAFWKDVAAEHALKNGEGSLQADWDSPLITQDGDGDGQADCLERIGVYFHVNASESAIPRALVVDLEPGTADIIKADPFLSNAFRPDNVINGKNGAGNNWAKGHYTEGAELVEEVLDKVRQEVERCEAPQGFQICHSIGGGTGSGMGTLLLLKIRDQYPDRITSTYTVGPSKKVSDVVLEPYNAVLSSHQLLENADETFLIDNEALYNISQNLLKNDDPTFDDMNKLIAQTMCGITSSLRFPGKLNGDLRKLGVNLVPFPRLHFFLIAQAPLFSEGNAAMTNTDVNELISQCTGGKNFFVNVKPDEGKYLAASFVFRGQMSTHEVDSCINAHQDKHADTFVEWIPNNLKTSVVEVAPLSSEVSATFVANTTNLKEIYQRYATQFGKLYKRKAFLHSYKAEGMDEMEFQEADKNVRDLITEYQDKQDAVYDGDDDQEESDV